MTPPKKYSSIRKLTYAQALAKATQRSRKPKKAIKKKRRSASEKQEKFEREYGGEEYLAFIQSKPCCACGFAGLPSEAAHTTTGGASRKADGKGNLAPLCVPRFWPPTDASRWYDGCHRESHRGIKSFQEKYGIDLKAKAALLWIEFQGKP
jgi:hypothetical protein